jgi:hypothetical protein
MTRISFVLFISLSGNICREIFRDFWLIKKSDLKLTIYLTAHIGYKLVKRDYCQSLSLSDEDEDELDEELDELDEEL